tara:strand:- start:1077 stop:1277 length:201 start_codon:yes stop_codon:yes gene_type:complete
MMDERKRKQIVNKLNSEKSQCEHAPNGTLVVKKSNNNNLDYLVCKVCGQWIGLRSDIHEYWFGEEV